MLVFFVIFVFCDMDCLCCVWCVFGCSLFVWCFVLFNVVLFRVFACVLIVLLGNVCVFAV